MKFLCDRCKTRYSIGDERVRGKILKIRCKNCANVITVREGMTDSEPEAPAAVPAARRTQKPTTIAPPAQVSAPMPPANGKPPPALEEEWYVSIDGDQSGPYSLHEAQRWISQKAITADLHCWSEGFDDWLPVDKVSHFRGLRKKPAAPAPVPAAPPPMPRAATGRNPVIAAPRVEEDEPKPLFAATMAAIEKSIPQQTAAPATLGMAAPAMAARSTPLGGAPALPVPAPKTNGTSPHAKLGATLPQPQRPAKQTGSLPPITSPISPLAKSSTGPRAAIAPVVSHVNDFGADDNAAIATQIEAPPFEDEIRTAAEPVASRRQQSAPVSQPVSQPAPLPFMPPPLVAPPVVARPAPPPEPAAPVIEPEGDIEIGEVSRVFKLADLAPRTPAPAKDHTGPMRRTSSVPRLATRSGEDPISAMVAMPDPMLAADGGMQPMQPSTQPESNKRMFILLGVVAFVLLAIVGVVVYVVSQNGDDDTTTVTAGRQIDLSRPDDPQHRVGPGETPGSAATKDPVTPQRPTQPHRPNIPTNPGSAKPQITEPDTSGTGALKADEVEAVARMQSEGTNRCYMRAQRGADAIIVGEVKRINVTITIDKEGVVQNLELSDHATDSLGKCLQSRIHGWKFRQSERGLTTRLTLVFQAT